MFEKKPLKQGQTSLYQYKCGRFERLSSSTGDHNLRFICSHPPFEANTSHFMSNANCDDTGKFKIKHDKIDFI
jgi:hypothetical protein